jgi:hypothetical protein
MTRSAAQQQSIRLRSSRPAQWLRIMDSSPCLALTKGGVALSLCHRAPKWGQCVPNSASQVNTSAIAGVQTCRWRSLANSRLIQKKGCHCWLRYAPLDVRTRVNPGTQRPVDLPTKGTKNTKSRVPTGGALPTDPLGPPCSCVSCVSWAKQTFSFNDPSERQPPTTRSGNVQRCS